MTRFWPRIVQSFDSWKGERRLSSYGSWTLFWFVSGGGVSGGRSPSRARVPYRPVGESSSPHADRDLSPRALGFLFL